MNDDQLSDLKQFIAASASQVEQRLSNELQELRQEVRDGFAGAGDAASDTNDQLSDHELRIAKLESAQT